MTVIKDNQSSYICKLGKACVPGMVNAGYSLMLLSILPVLSFQISGYISSIFIFIFGAFLAYTKMGIFINSEKQKVSSYIVYFSFIKFSKKIDINPFNLISVLMFNKNYTVRSLSNRGTSSQTQTYEVYMIAPDKKRQILAMFDNPKSAIEFAKEIAEKLKKKYVTYYQDI